MQIISLNNHIVRKALRLSLNEMAVLCDIKQMSTNPDFNFWCIKSKDKIAEWLDLSRSTVFNALQSLEHRGYIVRSEHGIRPSKFIYDLDSAQEEIGVYIKNNDAEMMSIKIVQILDGSKICTDTVQKLDGDSLKIGLQQSKNWTQDIHLDTQEEKKENIYAVEHKIIAYLNDKTKRNFKFKPNNAVGRALIKRLAEYGEDELIRMIDDRFSKWWNDSKMNEYLCPDTLFRESNCNKYIAVLPKKQTPQDKKKITFGIPYDSDDI